MKKFLVLFLCLQFIFLPAFAEYDFSDEAQAEFDKQRFQQTNFNHTDFSKKRNKTEIKNNNIERSNYTPIELNQEKPINLETQTIPNKTLTGSVIEIPEGTTFYITFDSGINSGSLEKNDKLIASLTKDFVYNGLLIAPAGSLVYGNATYAKNAGYAYGSGALEINFNQIITPDGNIIAISTEKIYIEEKSERAKKMSRDMLIGALGSMVVGTIFTAIGGGDDWGRNMLIYGGLGAAGGSIRGALQRGEDVDIPDGTTIELMLSQPLNTTPYNKSLQ